MTPIERQILENQISMMKYQNRVEFHVEIMKSQRILSDEKSEESCCEIPKNKICAKCGYDEYEAAHQDPKLYAFHEFVESKDGEEKDE